MALVEAVRSRVRRALVARSPGIDLSRLDRVPERLTWPLKREGMEPFHRVEELRETKGPVARVVTFLGVEVWLVTGDAEAREMLADQTSYSTDIRPYMGRSGSADGDIGGLGFTDPIYVQYGRWAKGIVVGADFDTGPSVEHCPAPCLGLTLWTRSRNGPRTSCSASARTKLN